MVSGIIISNSIEIGLYNLGFGIKFLLAVIFGYLYIIAQSIWVEKIMRTFGDARFCVQVLLKFNDNKLSF